MRVETELRLPNPFKKKQPDENQGLRNERQIALYRQQEVAKRERAERHEAEAKAREADARAREVEARVRHLNVALVQRVLLLVSGVAIGIALIIGAIHDPALLKISLTAAKNLFRSAP
ncbi:MAG: hypothetical protein ACTHNP_12105 [Solirubrobacterales bacterium]